MKSRLILGCVALAGLTACGEREAISPSAVTVSEAAAAPSAAVTHDNLPFALLRSAVLHGDPVVISHEVDLLRVPVAQKCLAARDWQASDSLMSAFITHAEPSATYADYATTLLDHQAKPADPLWLNEQFSDDMSDCWQQATTAIVDPASVLDDAMQAATQAVSDAVHKRSDFRAAEQERDNCYAAAGHSLDELATWNESVAATANKLVGDVTSGALDRAAADDQLANLEAEETAVQSVIGPCDATMEQAELNAVAAEQQTYLTQHPEFQRELEQAVKSVSSSG